MIASGFFCNKFKGRWVGAGMEGGGRDGGWGQGWRVGAGMEGGGREGLITF